MATSVSSRKEYLKQYLSGGADKKKKKKQKSQSSTGMRLVDDDDEPSRQISSVSFAPNSFAELDEEDLSGDELARFIAMKSQRESAKKKGSGGPAFRTDTFVTIDDDLPLPPQPLLKLPKIEPTTSLQRKRKVSQNHSDSDQDVPRPSVRKRKPSSDDEDMDLPRRTRRRSSPSSASDQDQSPVRRRPQSKSKSPSPPPTHRKKHGIEKVAEKEIKKEVVSEGEEAETGKEAEKRKTLEGKRAGLVRREEMVAEIDKLKKQKLTDGMDDEMTGRYAETKRRATNFSHSKRNKKDTPEDEARKQREATKQKELEEKYKTWSKGEAQIKERVEKMKEIEQTLNEGFSRYADDEAMNEHLKDQLLKEDPMAKYFETKRHKVKMRTGIVYPTYQGSWAPNRFSIAPGYRWDGVDRSNGFEGKIALAENKRRAQEDLTYRTIAELTE